MLESVDWSATPPVGHLDQGFASSMRATDPERGIETTNATSQGSGACGMRATDPERGIETAQILRFGINIFEYEGHRSRTGD